LLVNFEISQVFEHNIRYVFYPTGEEFANVFDTLSNNASEWGITTWSVNQTTLDGVFNKVLGEGDL